MSFRGRADGNLAKAIKVIAAPFHRSGNSFIVNNIELGGAERRGNFVFDNLGFGAVANNFVTGLDLSRPTNLQPN